MTGRAFGRVAPLARGDRLYRWQFPERPGALMRFLAIMHPDWTIGLFYQSNQGADYGRILVGVQAPDTAAFQDFADALGHP